MKLLSTQSSFKLSSIFYQGSIYLFIYFNSYFIHMCMQCLGHFSPLPHAPSLMPPPPPLSPLTRRYQAETIFPSSLILLKREYKQ
jgi:hypothetical protein